MRKATRLEKIHMGKVVDLGCIACHNMGPEYEGSPAEIHHTSTGGKSKRASHFAVLPLCPIHHRTGGHGRAIHAGRKTWEAKHGTEAELLEQVMGML